MRHADTGYPETIEGGQAARAQAAGSDTPVTKSCAERRFVLEKGQIRYHGTAREYGEDDSIRHRYLAL